MVALAIVLLGGLQIIASLLYGKGPNATYARDVLTALVRDTRDVMTALVRDTRDVLTALVRDTRDVLTAFLRGIWGNQTQTSD